MTISRKLVGGWAQGNLNNATGRRNFRLRSANRPIPLCRQSPLTSFRSADSESVHRAIAAQMLRFKRCRRLRSSIQSGMKETDKTKYEIWRDLRKGQAEMAYHL